VVETPLSQLTNEPGRTIYTALGSVLGFLRTLLLERVIYIGLGSLLGFLLTLLLQRINRKKRSKEFKESLSLEFQEVIPQLAGTHYLVKDALGELNLDVVKWTHSMLSKFPKGQEKLLKSIGRLLKRTDDDFKALASQTKTSKKRTMSIKKITLPFLQQNFCSISLLDSDLQRSVAGIQRNVNSLNEEIDLYSFYFKKTFDSSLNARNYELVNRNIDHAYRAIADLSYKVAEGISKTIPHL